LQKEFYMIDVFRPDSYFIRLSIINGEVCKNNGAYSRRGCLIAVYRESNEKNNTYYNACRYEDGGDIGKDITLLTPEKTIKKPLVGVVEEDIPKIIEMLGINGI